MHFKGIASEVRHNGVISFDKVMTALNKAIQQQSFLSIYEQENQPDENSIPAQQTINSLANYQSAIDAMRYLWALLDLSTADNMSLHIGNQLIECEEHYYQLQLDADRSLDSTQSIPSEPTFYPQLAALMTLSLLSDEPEIRDLISLAKINQSVLQERFEFRSELYYVQLEVTESILGNPNHIVLLLENLIKNALFFNSKSGYKQKTDRIGISLTQKNQSIRFKIYNRGPQIEGNLDDIFKLGFTTRRNKQHNGKGLGLFFVSEIVKGYQGKIRVENIRNQKKRYQLSLFQAEESIKSYQIETDIIDGKVKSRLLHEQNANELQKNQTEWLTEIKLEASAAIDSLKVCDIESKQETAYYEISPNEANSRWIDPDNKQKPQWQIQIKHGKRKAGITFKALDIGGVCFDISLPCADSCN